MSFGKIAAGIAVAAFLASTSAASAASLVTNGEFSNGSNPSLSGWSVDYGAGGTDHITANQQSSYLPWGGIFSPAVGFFAAFGDGDQQGGGISQVLETVIGKTYRLTFQYGGFGTAGGNAQSLAVGFTGSVSELITDASANLTRDFAGVFSSYTFDFVATDVFTTLSFDDVSVATGSADGMLTSVSVQAVPGPEAGAGLAGLAMAGLGAYMIRRRRQTATA